MSSCLICSKFFPPSPLNSYSHTCQVELSTFGTRNLRFVAPLKKFTTEEKDESLEMGLCSIVLKYYTIRLQNLDWLAPVYAPLEWLTIVYDLHFTFSRGFSPLLDLLESFYGLPYGPRVAPFLCGLYLWWWPIWVLSLWSLKKTIDINLCHFTYKYFSLCHIIINSSK